MRVADVGVDDQCDAAIGLRHSINTGRRQFGGDVVEEKLLTDIRLKLVRIGHLYAAARRSAGRLMRAWHWRAVGGEIFRRKRIRDSSFSAARPAAGDWLGKEFRFRLLHRQL